jgi:glycosyltransferase XagB
MVEVLHELRAPSQIADRRIDRPLPAGRGPIRPLGRPLPPELEFLTRHGISLNSLLRALAAAPWGVEPLDALLGEGIVAEEHYYHALAQHLGCAYFAGEQPFAKHFDVAKALLSGVAPLSPHGGGPRAVMAPRAALVPGLIEMRASGGLAPESFAVASPSRFAALVRMRRGEAVLADALRRLPDRLSARRAMSGLQIAAAGLVAICAAALGAWDLRALTGAASAMLWLLFSTSIVLRSAAAIAHADDVRSETLSDDELPVYTVVVALYREAAVVEDLVSALDALDYPKSKLDIKLVTERRDHETVSRILAMRLPARYELVIAPPGNPPTKPRALDIALATARGELIVVYDAEDAPSPDQLRLAASRFAADRGLDCLQARLTIRNADDSWLSKLFAAEYAVLFDLINPGLCALGLPIALGGSSNHFRFASLTRVGGWDAWNVAEDADLGVRLARFGYRVGSLNSDTSEEAPRELGNWFRQRVRWQKGWMQTSIVHAREPLALVSDLGLHQTLSATVLISGAVLSALFWPVFALDVLMRAFEAGQGVASAWREATDVFVYILALAGIWSMLVPATVAAKLRGLNLNAATLALSPVYYSLVSLAAWVAILDLVRRPHFWAKTEHGRTRRQTPRRTESFSAQASP